MKKNYDLLSIFCGEEIFIEIRFMILKGMSKSLKYTRWSLVYVFQIASK